MAAHAHPTPRIGEYRPRFCLFGLFSLGCCWSCFIAAASGSALFYDVYAMKMAPALAPHASADVVPIFTSPWASVLRLAACPGDKDDGCRGLTLLARVGEGVLLLLARRQGGSESGHCRAAEPSAMYLYAKRRSQASTAARQTATLGRLATGSLRTRGGGGGGKLDLPRPAETRSASCTASARPIASSTRSTRASQRSRGGLPASCPRDIHAAVGSCRPLLRRGRSAGPAGRLGRRAGAGGQDAWLYITWPSCLAPVCLPLGGASCLGRRLAICCPVLAA